MAYPGRQPIGELSFGDGSENVVFRYVRGRAEYDLKDKGSVRMARAATSDDLLVEVAVLSGKLNKLDKYVIRYELMSESPLDCCYLKGAKLLQDNRVLVQYITELKVDNRAVLAFIVHITEFSIKL